MSFLITEAVSQTLSSQNPPSSEEQIFLAFCEKCSEDNGTGLILYPHDEATLKQAIYVIQHHLAEHQRTITEIPRIILYLMGEDFQKSNTEYFSDSNKG